MKDIEEIKKKLSERFWSKRRNGINLDVGRKGSEENDILSGLAEKCGCDFLGCEFNIEIYDNHGDGGYDFIYKGKKVDVKWMGIDNYTKEPRKNGRIIVFLEDIGKADIYIAVIGNEEIGFICNGWCTSEDIKSKPLWNSTSPDKKGSFQRYAIHTKDLRSMEELIKYEESSANT